MLLTPALPGLPAGSGARGRLYRFLFDKEILSVSCSFSWPLAALGVEGQTEHNGGPAQQCIFCGPKKQLLVSVGVCLLVFWAAISWDVWSCYIVSA